MTRIQRALISVSNKQGIVEFARELHKLNIEIISTGGTADLLRKNKISCREISDLIQFPEMLDGRVKTLHPIIYGGILARREYPDHLNQLQQLNIGLIDLVVVNLYPFEETISQSGVTKDIAIENIDIGGPSMIRAAAKNYQHVGVVTSPKQYPWILSELRNQDGCLTPATLGKLAIEAFQLTQRYDGVITTYLSNLEKNALFPERVCLSLKKIQDLRYGENAHQHAAFYHELDKPLSGIANLQQLHGKELSYNNLLDLDSVIRMVATFDDPCCVIVKHNNPCGVAIGVDLLDAFQKAFATDSVSAFGGIYGFNRTVDVKLSEVLSDIFIEAIVAFDYTSEAFSRLSKKKNIRLLKLNVPQRNHEKEFMVRTVLGGYLIQETDALNITDLNLNVVTKRQPTTAEWKALKLGWQVVKWIKSNAIVFVRGDRTIGIGAGQMSRVDSVILATDKAKRAGLSLQGTALASDAFFPFRDGIDHASDAGAVAVIQPGGSIRDEEVIEAANEHNMAMVFTGVRHFRH